MSYLLIPVGLLKIFISMKTACLFSHLPMARPKAATEYYLNPGSKKGGLNKAWAAAVRQQSGPLFLDRVFPLAGIISLAFSFGRAFPLV